MFFSLPRFRILSRFPWKLPLEIEFSHHLVSTSRAKLQYLDVIYFSSIYFPSTDGGELFPLFFLFFIVIIIISFDFFHFILFNSIFNVVNYIPFLMQRHCISRFFFQAQKSNFPPPFRFDEKAIQRCHSITWFMFLNLITTHVSSPFWDYPFRFVPSTLCIFIPSVFNYTSDKLDTDDKRKPDPFILRHNYFFTKIDAMFTYINIYFESEVDK